MLKLHQGLDDDVMTRKLPSLCTRVLGQTDESGRRVADLKSCSLTVTSRCLILCLTPITFVLGTIMLISKGTNTEEERNLSTRTALTRLQSTWSCLVPSAVSDFFWYQ